jgi:hypothetical protein
VGEEDIMKAFILDRYGSKVMIRLTRARPEEANTFGADTVSRGLT